MFQPSFLFTFLLVKLHFRFTLKPLFFILIISFFFVSCKEKTILQPKFIEVADSGISFSNTVQNTPELNILNYLYFYNGAGTAIADFNNDGLDDIYFTSNQQADQLYINKGKLQFTNTTSLSGIQNDQGWTTGVTTVDINNDGRMDIYVSKINGHLEIEGSNLLFINQGNTPDGIPQFKEQATTYNLALKGLTTQASFFDYDVDGDLDVFILNHSLHPNSNYGKGGLRTQKDSIYGDKLLENQNGRFIDVTDTSGIFQSRLGYGLGISISDINNDGYPDIYLGNDFFENDYLYINQKNKTFVEVNSTQSALGHSSHFSMGNAITDVNNDGHPDIMSLDMLPEDLHTLKVSGAEYNYPIFQNQLRNGYEPQFMQNTLHLNLGNGKYAETAFLSGISATEWSWSPLIADFDNDGHKDIYITNGIQGATNDMDFVNFISNESIQKKLGQGMSSEELKFIDELPEKKTVNYFYKNIGNAQFEDVSNHWQIEQASFSNGASYADLDNDGDVDLVVNNVNQNAFILENTTQVDSSNTNYIKIHFEGSPTNTKGIGAKVIVYAGKQKQFFENYTTQGYLSATPPSILVGLGNQETIDSLQVIWPDGKYQTLQNTKANQRIILNYNNTSENTYPYTKQSQTSFITNTTAPIDFNHRDGTSIEFSRSPLIPYASTNLGPHIAIGDLTNDQREDILTLGAKGQSTQLWIQDASGNFQVQELPDAKNTQIHEDTHALIFDANGDQINDVLIVSGGNEFKQGKPLTPRLYLTSQNTLQRDETQFKDLFVNASKVTAIDIDNDGDMDVCITANVVPHQFGKTPTQYLFKNDGKGHFEEITNTYAKDFQNIGNVYDITWQDLNGNGYPDAIVAGHWMPISIFINDGTSLTLQKTTGLKNTHGWWNSIKVADFDNDGDQDIIAGNWGLNTRLKPTLEEPVTLYRNDFDNNNQIDPIVTYYYQGTETTIATKDELVKQIPLLNKKYLSYNAFAKADIEQLLDKKKLQESEKKEAYLFASTYFENKGNNTFQAHELPFLAQVSTVEDILIEDFDQDGFLDALLVGNNYEISTQLGRLDGSHGVFLKNDTKGNFIVLSNQDYDISGASRSIQKIKITDRIFYVVGRNNDTPIFLKQEK
ncbi:Repeat domain-containing protein [Dokdonia pacifica]|uniref:Repeat domain-containing protein n=1 Tax=Dokdonia pacifica TaxID=1627892 RepID=A0A238VSJ3_9FLAO|nr:Repeat domain-containing protein [Dokdonia pacifica]